MASVEDTILAKLDWFRQGGEVSDRQWRDAIGLLKIHKNSLDMKYLQETAKELRLADLLKRALKVG